MKRTPLTRKTPLKSSGKPMKPRGETKRKKEARYQAYMRSPEWKAKRNACLDRAGNRCEWTEMVDTRWDGVQEARCMSSTKLQAHHRTYLRFGGNELPEDLQCLCSYHHQLVEHRDYPHRHTHRRTAA